MRARGLIMALLFVSVLVAIAWLTGESSPFADKPSATTKSNP
ncbi:hypothetical protein DB30_06771 [Enhygromyxa salina]|uniref:Uncharacterized protein n=1 Tax=Enhygromyxa salina TaxID=215803 RepID=A0A0C1ZTP6_9BACT|nr:hypothetical protein [Enhygromyxa salina]KIG14428.1 hypothetical protein DB30_06771 [Enhygromyxa salina]